VEQAVPNDEVQRADRNAVTLRARSRKAAEAMSKEMGMYTSEEVTRPGE
jgi:ABC-type Fe3+-citrate transport system substrate-binding protein